MHDLIREIKHSLLTYKTEKWGVLTEKLSTFFSICDPSSPFPDTTAHTYNTKEQKFKSIRQINHSIDCSSWGGY